jgi:hypothetical protein
VTPKIRQTIANGKQRVQEVNRPQREAELDALRRSVQRGRPYGDDAWVKRTA